MYSHKINNNITNLVFQGGGVKGIAYLGALPIIQERIGLRNIKRVAGTSAGAIFALLLCLGYEPEGIKKLLLDFKFSEVLDGSSKIVTHQASKAIDKLAGGASEVTAKIPLKLVELPLAYTLLNQFGIFDGEYIRIWAENIIEEGVRSNTSKKIPFLTFAELHALHEQYPDKFKDLYIVGVNINRGEEITFCYEQTPNLIISDAIRISMSIPGIFKPHIVYIKINGTRTFPEDERFNGLFVDGGLFNNYPIRCFDNSSVDVNHDTLGFRLVNKNRIDYLQGLSEAPEREVNNFLAFTKAILLSVMSKQEYDFNVSPNDKSRTVCIDHLGISTLNFNLTIPQQEALIQSGADATKQAFGIEIQENVITNSHRLSNELSEQKDNEDNKKIICNSNMRCLIM